MMLPLAGIRVLDFSRLLPGPYATLMLAEAGAQVIKLEHPDGEEMRRYGPPWDAAGGAPFALLNKGKEGISADLSDPGDLGEVKKLAASVDVIVEQFRPETMKKFGLDYATVRLENPSIIYCSISGYGKSGPWSGRAGHDLNYLAETGVLGMSPGTPGARTVPPVALADLAGGSYPAIINILLALRRRDQTGEGCFIDISMTDGLFPLMYLPWATGHAEDAWPHSGGERFTGGSPRYNLYDTKDGKILAVGAVEDKFWHRFCQVIGLDSSLSDADPAEVTRAVRELIIVRDAEYWATLLEEADCCCSIVQNLKEALQTKHFEQRLPLHRTLRTEEGREIPALPLPLAPQLTRVPSATAAPVLGSANAQFGLRKRSVRPVDPVYDRSIDTTTSSENA